MSIANSVARNLGVPCKNANQDIEFAVLDGTVYLLQARPVTTNESSPESEVPWEEGMDTSYGWVLNQLSSRGPLYRLQQYAFHFYLEDQRRCFEETGSGRNRNHIGHFTNGYVYARPPNDIDEKVVEERQARHTARWDSCAGQGTSYYESVQKPIIEERLAELKHLRPRKDDLPKLVGYMEACMKNWGYVSGHLHWCMNKSGPTPDWPATYHEITGEPSVNSSVFVQAIPNSTTHLVKRLQKLARIVQSDPELSTAFARNDYGILENPDYQQRPAAQSFKKSFRSLLSIHGQRTGWSFGSSAGITTPTWNMEPERALDMIASYAEQDLDRLEQLEADARRERKTAVRRTRRQFSDTPDLLKRFEMGRLAAIGQVKQMENHNHMMEQRTTGTMREAIHFVGEALVAKRLIDDPDDVLHLSFDELGEVAKGSGLDDLRTLVRERAKERENRSRFSPPPTLGDGPIPENPFGRMGELPSGVGLHGNTLQGVAASRGRQTGPARLVLPGKPRPNIRPGDVLVAGNVGQEWTPVMSVLGGLVLDQGAVFQHAALVAREYRIPAVLMTKEATSVIKEGQTITVDGDSGVVELDG